MTNPDSVLKSRDINLPTKVCLVKAMGFPVVMYRCENWTIKKAEHQKIDAFELWCWRTLLRVPWTARRSNQSILKEINPEYSLEGLMLKLKLQTFGWKRPWSWGKNEGQRRRGWQRIRWRDCITDSMDMNLNKLWEIVKDRGACVLQSMGLQSVRHNLVTEQQEQPEFTSAWKLRSGPYWKLAVNKLQILRWDHPEFRMGPKSGNWWLNDTRRGHMGRQRRGVRRPGRVEATSPSWGAWRISRATRSWERHGARSPLESSWLSGF